MVTGQQTVKAAGFESLDRLAEASMQAPRPCGLEAATVRARGCSAMRPGRNLSIGAGATHSWAEARALPADHLKSRRRLRRRAAALKREHSTHTLALALALVLALTLALALTLLPHPRA